MELSMASHEEGDEEDSDEDASHSDEGEDVFADLEESGVEMTDVPNPAADSSSAGGKTLQSQFTMSANGHKLDKRKSRRRSSGAVYAVYEPEHKPNFIYSMVLINCVMLVLELVVNARSKTAENPCSILLGPFCFESMSENPFLGPSADTLLSMGAKTGTTVVVDGQ
jgi:hypothetical protein